MDSHPVPLEILVWLSRFELPHRAWLGRHVVECDACTAVLTALLERLAELDSFDWN